MSRGFSQTGFNPLQRHDALAFKVAFSRSRQDRFGSKTVLNPESILHDPSQSFVLNFCHASNVTNESHNRKSILAETKTARVLARAVAPGFPGARSTRRNT
jgi:hypothetical protein